MKYLSALLLFLLCLTWAGFTFGQSVNFEDGFEDGDFTNDPEWTGDTDQFTVIDSDPNHLLQLQGDDENGDVSYLSTPSTEVEGSWEFFINLNFSPSNGNRADVFLMSDIENLEGNVNGYAIRAGENGTDDVFHLVRYENGSEAETVLSGTTDISSGGAFRVKVTRESGGDWTLEVGKEYDGQLTEEGTATNNSITSSSYFGIRATYTSTRHDLFTLDFKIDLPPFTVENSVAEDNEIDVTFNRPYDENTADESDFFVDNGLGEPITISNSDETTITLSYNDPIPSGSYTLTVNDIDDLNGETITGNTTSQFVIFGTYEEGDIIINEFAYDYPTTINEEYVEIKNTSDKYLNLADWQIADNSSSSSLGSGPIPIEPDSFLVVSADTTELYQVFGERAYHEAGFPALNNNPPDAVQLITNDGSKADSLTYTSDWGGTDVALERRSVSTASIYQENWGESPNPNGGTPGAANEVETDDTPPFIDDIQVVDATTVKILFSESVTSESATDEQNYQLDPHRDIQLIAAENNNVELMLSQELLSEQTYTIRVSNISDIFGNETGTLEYEITYLRIDDAQPGDIVINEIMYEPGDDEADFVELYNASEKNFDLSDWRVGDSSNETSFNGGELLADEYIVLTGNEIFANSVSNGLHISGFPALNNNTPDAVYIKNEEGQTIDSLRYSQTWGGNSDGTSLERKDPLAASNDASNWQTSTSNNGNSAGTQNAGFQEDSSPPEVVFSKIKSGGTIEVRFNEFIRLTDEVEFLMDGQELSVVNFDSANANIVTLQSPPAKSSKANSSAITINNLSDVRGNTTASTEIAVAQPLQPADLVINEIMFNPLSDSDDNQPDQGEYIELRNTQDYAISLEGLFLHDEPDENGEVRDLQPVTSTAKWVPAQGQVLVHADPAETFEDSRVSKFFGIESPNPQSMMRVDRTTLSLASTDDAIYIADSTGATVDSVFYDQSWHNPNIIDTRGIALERITPTGASDDESNWGSSVNEKGGTPNSENSIYQESAQGPEGIGISFTPNPFSPDDDGHEDNLFINYKLDQQDYLIKVQIFDRYGRLVRELADGKQAGFEGQLIWDGRKNDNSRNRIGIYIVVFEAYDSASGKDRSFKETVVLARRLN